MIVSSMLLAFLLFSSCKKTDFVWNLPAGFPEPAVPADNAMSAAKAELGRHLFYDRRLSGDESMSCSSCHLQSLAFTDGKKNPHGVPRGHGMLVSRNAPTIVNSAWHYSYTWINPGVRTLENQALVPMFSIFPTELGLTDRDRQAIEKIRKDEKYGTLFRAAFNESDPFTLTNVVRAIASFERTIISGNSAYDEYSRGNATALSESAKKGLELFKSERAKCSSCHAGFNFSDFSPPGGENQNAALPASLPFHSNGIYAAYPDPVDNYGLQDVTNNPADQGKFKTPSLRNIAVTFPYMHDGSFDCDPSERPAAQERSETCARSALGRVIDHYASGGKDFRNKDSRIRPFAITDEEKKSLIDFLMSLTDESILKNAAFSNPRPGDSNFGP